MPRARMNTMNTDGFIPTIPCPNMVYGPAYRYRSRAEKAADRLTDESSLRGEPRFYYVIDCPYCLSFHVTSDGRATWSGV